MNFRRTQGFTLLEIMTVLAIIAIAAGAVGAAISNSNPTLAAEGGLKNLSQAFANLSEQAAITKQSIGLKFSDDGILKYALQEEVSDSGDVEFTWLELEPMDVSFFADHDLVLRFASQDGYFNAADSQTQIIPDIEFFAHGEYLPEFQLFIEDENGEIIAQAKGDGFNQMYAVEIDDAPF